MRTTRLERLLCTRSNREMTLLSCEPDCGTLAPLGRGTARSEKREKEQGNDLPYHVPVLPGGLERRPASLDHGLVQDAQCTVLDLHLVIREPQLGREPRGAQHQTRDVRVQLRKVASLNLLGLEGRGGVRRSVQSRTHTGLGRLLQGNARRNGSTVGPMRRADGGPKHEDAGHMHSIAHKGLPRRPGMTAAFGPELTSSLPHLLTCLTIALTTVCAVRRSGYGASLRRSRTRDSSSPSAQCTSAIRPVIIDAEMESIRCVFWCGPSTRGCVRPEEGSRRALAEVSEISTRPTRRR